MTILKKRLQVCTAMLAVLMSSQALYAQTAGFSLNLSSSEQLLANPDDPNVMHFQSWDSPLIRMMERNMPFIELSNSMESTVALTEFRMSIGKDQFNFSDDVFGAYAQLGATTPGASILSTAGGDELVILFGNGGLQPGEIVRFQVDIDVDPGNPDEFIHPDYRTVFFDYNDDDDSNNSLAVATFGTGADALVARRLLPDVNTGGAPVFLNQDIRPYSVMEMVERVEIPDGVIPEPSSLALAFMTAVTLIGRRRRS